MTNCSSPAISLKDLTVLDEVKKVFHRTTGLVLSFYYQEKHEYDFYPSDMRCGFCRAVQGSLDGRKRCLKSDRKALEKTKTVGEPVRYVCHAGLENAVISLVYKGRDIGAIYTGQVLTGSKGSDHFDHVYQMVSDLGLDRAALYREYCAVQQVDPSMFVNSVKLLNFMANHIVSVEDEMCLQEELYRKEREILRYENEQMRLKNQLQKLTIAVLKDSAAGSGSGSRAGGSLQAGDQPAGGQPRGYQPEGGLSRVDQEPGARARARGDRESGDRESGDRESGESRRGCNPPKEALVARAQEFIHTEYRQPLTLSDVAEAVCLSPNYFSTVFKEITGNNFTTYLNMVRVQEGKRMLRDTGLPIKQIVHQVGFENYNYFNRVFSKIAGMPPAAYREMFSSGYMEGF